MLYVLDRPVKYLDRIRPIRVVLILKLVNQFVVELVDGASLI
jgi:hypothetical protein